MMYLGDFLEDAVVRFPFCTNAADGGRESFSASLEEADIVILKDGVAMTLDASTITISLDLGSRVGVHTVAVDMGNDADFTTGSDYAAILYTSDETLDSQAPAAVLATWSCENRTVTRINRGYADNTVWFEKDASGGTTLHIHGTYETPVGDWEDAKTLADQLSRKVKVKSRAGNPTHGITVGAVDLSYLDIDANGHQLSSLSSTTLTGATLRNGRTGSAMTLTQASKLVDFHSELGILTMSPSGTDIVMPCAINSDIFSVAIADAPSIWIEPIRFIGCRTHWSTVAMAVNYTDPDLSSTRLSFENHTGNLNFTNFPDESHVIVVTGHGIVTIAESCLGGTLYYGPGIKVVNNGEMNTVALVTHPTIETGITPSAALTNDSGAQLSEVNLPQAVALILSMAAAGKLTGAAGPTTESYPAGNPGGNVRVSADVDATGRTAVRLKVPD